MLQEKLDEFVNIAKRLRKECPWDREQTNDSIKASTLEEAYEVVHSIDENDYNELKKELGDLLFHIVFHSIMAEEKNEFNLENVIDEIQSKLIRRHPHIFGNVKVNDSKDVKKNWETIKLKEGRKSLLDGIPTNMPALLRAFRVQEKTSKIGFDWKKKEQVWDKVIEEIDELKKSEQSAQPENIEEELGDLFFALTNYARFLSINPENALRKSTLKFEERFKYIENKIKEQNKNLNESTLEEMNYFWEESKNKKNKI
ncbi:MAG: nucleoside triphosphate pyrophosphohydrolase [Ignavibacterium sp.]